LTSAAEAFGTLLQLRTTSARSTRQLHRPRWKVLKSSPPVFAVSMRVLCYSTRPALEGYFCCSVSTRSASVMLMMTLLSWSAKRMRNSIVVKNSFRYSLAGTVGLDDHRPEPKTFLWDDKLFSSGVCCLLASLQVPHSWCGFSTILMACHPPFMFKTCSTQYAG